MNKKLNYFSSIRFLSKYTKNYKKHFLMFYIGWLLDSILTLIMPILFGIMIDEIVYYQNVTLFLKIALVFSVCIIFSTGLYFLIYAQHGYLMNMFVFSIRKDIFVHLQKCDAQYLANMAIGEVVEVVQKYTGECMHFIIRNIIHTVNGLLMILMYSIYLVIIDWRIGAIAILTGGASVFTNTVFRGKIRKLGEKEREQYGKTISWIYEVLGALRDIRLLGAKEKVEELFEGNQKKLLNVGMSAELFSLTADRVLAFLNLAVRLIIYVIAAIAAVGGSMTLGTLTVVFKFYEKLTQRIESFSRSYLDAQMRISYIQKIYDFLKTPIEQGGTQELSISKGEIKFQNVTFGYEGREVLLEDVTFNILSGERVAIIGKSGCGKTTIAQLLIGFYQPQNGNIEIDGQTLADCTLQSIRKRIGFVQQDVLVFDGTIRQNLLMGNIHADEEQLIEACRCAGLEEFLATLDEGLDTVIGTQGIGLSGGQKQRIAIARIYLKNPAIVIFDEATSALDNETEEVIHQLWDKTLEGKTSIIIAHRQSSVMLCDRVILMEDGKIAEEGNPYAMIGSSERFRTLFAIKGER